MCFTSALSVAKPIFSPEKNLVIVTGPSGSGKTTWCATLAGHAKANNIKVGGVLCPPVFVDGRKTGFEIFALANEQRRLLARRADKTEASSIGCWSIDSLAMDWANDTLQNHPPCDILIIDELGPLEFERGGGFQAAFPLLDAARYRTAYVVIRPDLVNTAMARWPQATVLNVSETRCD